MSIVSSTNRIFSEHQKERAKRLYSNLISKSLSRVEVESGEWHHILPKSLFPAYKDDDWNKTKLTFKEHLLAHHLLVVIFEDVRLVKAHVMMRGRLSLSASSSVRKIYMKSRSDDMKLKWKDPSYRSHMTELSRLRMLRNLESAEFRSKLSEDAKLQWMSDEFRELMKNVQFGYRANRTCEFCNREMNAGAIKRFHGKFCKMNPDRVIKKKITRTNKERTCPHCSRNLRNKFSFHVENCSMNPKNRI